MTSLLECDGCNNLIMLDRFGQQPPVFDFTLPAEKDDHYESYQFALCAACREDIVKQILEDDESVPEIDMTETKSTVSSLRSMAQEISELADELEESL